MKNMKRFLTVLMAFTLLTGVSLYAQNPSKIALAMGELEKKYNETKGMDCMTFTKGKGLEMIKMVLNKELGKTFMKGVTSVTIIDYSEASEQVCQSFNKDLDVITTQLKELGTEGEKRGTRSFACTSNVDAGKLSDFIIVMEGDGKKTMMYMAGCIAVE